MTILVVEDEREVRTFLCELLNDEGYHAVGMNNGATALEWLRATSQLPQLILLDLMMPVMSGWTFRDHQLAEPQFAAIPVIIISAIVDRGGSLLPGVTAMLPKPVPIEQLLNLVTKHTTKQHRL
jgi:CheY-like chemotaxis protein